MEYNWKYEKISRGYEIIDRKYETRSKVLIGNMKHGIRNIDRKYETDNWSEAYGLMCEVLGGKMKPMGGNMKNRLELRNMGYYQKYGIWIKDAEYLAPKMKYEIHSKNVD